MSIARKIKRSQLKEIIGKCRRCVHAYDPKHKEKCTECHKSGEHIYFKRRSK